VLTTGKTFFWILGEGGICCFFFNFSYRKTQEPQRHFPLLLFKADKFKVEAGPIVKEKSSEADQGWLTPAKAGQG
jgi:hypothetical protein